MVSVDSARLTASLDSGGGIVTNNSERVEAVVSVDSEVGVVIKEDRERRELTMITLTRLTQQEE